MDARHPDGPVVETPVRARSYELDALGHVNHAVFFNWFEHARYEFLEACGLSLEAMAERGWAVVVVHAEADFAREVRQGDELTIRTRVSEVGGASVTLEQEAWRETDGERVATGSVVAVWLGAEGRPLRIPEEVRATLVPSGG